MISLKKLDTYNGIATCDVSGDGRVAAVVSIEEGQTYITMYSDMVASTRVRISGHSKRRDVALNYSGDILVLGDSAVDRVLVFNNDAGRLTLDTSIMPRGGALFNVSGFGRCVSVSPDGNVITATSKDSTFYKYARKPGGDFKVTLSTTTGDLANIRNRWSLANYNSDIADDCMHRAYGAKYNHTHMVSLADNPKSFLSITDNFITFESIDEMDVLTTVETMITPTIAGASQYDVGLSHNGAVGAIMITNTNMGVMTSTLYRVIIEV